MAEHHFRHVHVRDDTILQGPNRLDALGSPTQHSLGLQPDTQDLLGPLLHRNHGGLVQDDPLSLHIDEGIGRSQVHGDVIHRDQATGVEPTGQERRIFVQHVIGQEDWASPTQNRIGRCAFETNEGTRTGKTLQGEGLQAVTDQEVAGPPLTWWGGGLVLPPLSLSSRAPEPPTPTPSLGEAFGLLDGGSLEAGEDHLGDPIAPVDRHGFRAGVLQEDPYLTPVIGVDRTGAVGEGDPVAGRQTRPGADLALHTRRQLHHQAGGNGPDLPRSKLEGRLGRADIIASGLGSGPAGEGEVRVALQASETDRWADRHVFHPSGV